MAQPQAVAVSRNQVRAIAACHDLDFDHATPISSNGIINTIFALGESYILRFPRNHPAHIQQAQAEAKAIPIAVAAGIRTPRLIAFADDRRILPVPYLIVERVHGTDLESLGSYPPSAAGAWRELGCDLARLHGLARLHAAGPDGWPNPTPDEFSGTDPRALVEDRVRDGWISAVEGRWFARWLDLLAPAANMPVQQRRVHGDVQMSNILVDPISAAYVALLDWGCARRDDAAADFLPMPMRAVPHLLAGHREIAPLDDDDTVEARILWRRLQLALGVLPRGAAPDCAWGERPVGWLIDLLRFFLETSDERWHAYAPHRLGQP